MTVQDQIALDNHRLNLGLINKAELMVEYNKDLTLKEAEAKLEENKSKLEKPKEIKEAKEVEEVEEVDNQDEDRNEV